MPRRPKQVDIEDLAKPEVEEIPKPAPVARVNVQKLAPISAVGEVVAKRKAQLRELDRKRG